MAASCPAVPDVPPPLGVCLEGVRRGERWAAEALVRQCEPQVRRLVRAHRPRAVPEDDLVQEVFLSVFTRLDRYQAREGIPFEHWLSRLTINLCRDALRAERRRSPGHPLSAEALVAELPAEDRLLLTLLSLEERTLEEVSALTGRSRTVLKVRAFRARRRLQDAARRLFSTGGGTSDE